jgi:hypothetical protein
MKRVEMAKGIRMKVFRAAALIGLLAGPAFAQAPEAHVPGYGEADPDKTPSQIQQAKDAEKAYKNSLGNVPDQGPVDPWGNTRNVGEPRPAKAAARTGAKAVVKPKTKTTDTAK